MECSSSSGAPITAEAVFFPPSEPNRTSSSSAQLCSFDSFVSSFTSCVCRITAPASVRLLHPPPPCSSPSTALDAAVEFQQQFVVPGTWKTEVKEESSSSEDDDEDEDEEQEEDASGREEEEVEASLTQPPSSGGKVCKCSGSLSAGGGGTLPRGAGELFAAALQVYGGQR